jgi:heptosyltransferase I
MGDVLHAMPAVTALRELHPDWMIGWAIDPAWSELLEAETKVHNAAWRFAGRGLQRPLVDVWSEVRSREWRQRPFALRTTRDISALRRELRADRYDVCVDMQGAIRSAVVGRMAAAKVFAGPAEPREAPAAWLYGRKIKLSATHVVEQGCELLGAAVGETLRPAKVSLPVEEAAERWCDGLVTQVGEQFVVVAPTAGWGAKQWPAERYGALAAELGRAGFRTLVNASNVDDSVCKRVVETSGGAAMLVPCSLGKMISLLRRAELVIAGDTGPLHLAAALGRPVVGLYGPTDPARNGPFGTEARVLRHVSSTRDHSRRTETEAGLMQITTGEVVETALDLLRAGQDKVNV